MLAFLSSAGQTYFIGVFGADIQAEFGLDAGSWGRTYMIGTLASALVINWTGALIDRVDLRLFTALVLTGLAGACLVMASASTALMLIPAIFLLRQFGQGLTSHAGITSMARYHDLNRGKAIALAAIGFAKAEVTIGGISTSELSSRTMEAKKVPGLYAIGEAVDVTGWLGGYNFQWAWASGVAAGEALVI